MKSCGYQHETKSCAYRHETKSCAYRHETKSCAYRHETKSCGYRHKTKSCAYRHETKSCAYRHKTISLIMALQNPMYVWLRTFAPPKTMLSLRTFAQKFLNSSQTKVLKTYRSLFVRMYDIVHTYVQIDIRT